MKKAVIDVKKCDKSPFCPVKRVCPVKAVSQKVRLFGSGTPVIDKDVCIGCGKCVPVCPMKAVKMHY
ncbi:4Fe-4S binding protein [Fusibacter sp. JL216-2]|uniref:4Fe-4S binding protein n=1 Tax=Fusibacter sp. JL216-2 TaxID=3071453 RepID=UPI003D350A61